jgi:hypothetical protein
MKTVVVGAAIAVGVGIAGIGVAAPAMAQPVFGCAPCVDVPVISDTGETVLTPTPIWNAIFDATDGVPGDGEGAWEKIFPPAP